MNTQVKFPFHLHLTPLSCRTFDAILLSHIRRCIHFVAFTFKKCSRSVSFASLRCCFIAFAFCFAVFAFHSVQLSVVFALQGSRYSCMTSSGSFFLLQQNGTFRSVNMFALLAFLVCSLCVLLSFVDLLSVFRQSFKRSLSVCCTFNACFALAFALNDNGKGTF